MKFSENQELIIKSNDNLLILASAGCGKTHTLVNKVKYLMNQIKQENILIISFTNETVNDLKNKLPNNTEIYTFHKLAIKLLSNYKYSLCNEHLLKYIIDEYFESIITNKEKLHLKFYFLEFNYKKLVKLKSFNSFKQTVHTFIKLYQCNNYNIGLFKYILNSKDNFIISLIIKIYYIYENEKKSMKKLDLDDLIVEATKYISNKKFNYKYIFIDEFQDSSYIRFNLIYKIFKNSNSIINFFGDDYQSIYAFSGCNINIMLDITKYIPNIRKIILDINYRSDNKLINNANTFINKNDRQIIKDIVGIKNIDNSINFIRENELIKLIEELKTISNDIMVLARYKHNLKIIPDKYIIRKLTVHQSKGLEAKYVIILGLTDEMYGFPSKLKDHKILNYLKDDFMEIKYAEERRLFYVALTRCTEKVFLIIPNNPSMFLKEIKKIVNS